MPDAFGADLSSRICRRPRHLGDVAHEQQELERVSTTYLEGITATEHLSHLPASYRSFSHHGVRAVDDGPRSGGVR